ncbi:MAG: nuclear transport factor 2 family protein [Myxococcota bacterium]|jgi:hypothetical protein|nr:nuclear transport factor 2 family protein [Myxococcota bacterium]
MHVDKEELRDQLLAQVRADLDALIRTQDDAAKSATHSENRAEHSKDTRATEQSYLARGTRKEQQTMPQTGTPSPVQVAETYFARVCARDLSIVDLFHDDAELIGVGKRKKGRAAIHEFYSGVIERAGPTPTIEGSLLGNDERVAAEIFIQFENGAKLRAVDVFIVEDGRIRSLTYFVLKDRG